ncbi:TetR/AcrR family transcriptional regulator [Cellulomonas sp. NPDC089187]|uniref:TetR/AcrR family transcriptional regulator n=1 Tax=Cellulomonas sp. NPDC089187 TaxID=3154970 RepID=UPI0034390789
MEQTAEATRLLDAAESLFYEDGYQAVGMDRIRAASGLSLKRIYAMCPSKEALTLAVLDRRDDTWHAALEAGVDRQADPRARVLAVFTWLSEWLSGPGHRGCAWINAFGELGGTSPVVVAAVRAHKDRFRRRLRQLVEQAGGTPQVGQAVFLLAEGAMVTAGITGETIAVDQARELVAQLLPA